MGPRPFRQVADTWPLRPADNQPNPPRLRHLTEGAGGPLRTVRRNCVALVVRRGSIGDMCVIPSLWLENNKLQDGDLSINRQGRTTGASRRTRISGWHVCSPDGLA